MPPLRAVVDQDTGEVYQVETTRQAKRRHQRNGGQHPKPTAGQINAADIWNKQEEKIKRDREREAKRRRDKEKQEIREARQRELQLKKLQAGRITVEDTWGKVNASQNRLHKFFGHPKSLALNDLIPAKKTCKASKDVSRGWAHGESPEHQLSDTLLQDLDDFFTTSPLSPDTVQKSSKTRSSFRINSALFPQREQAHSAPDSQKLMMPQDPLTSQLMMPPPKRRCLSPPSSETTRGPTSDVSKHIPDQPQLVPTRQPLREMTLSQVNKRASEKFSPDSCTPSQSSHLPTSTQVAKETLSGLCSQDFEDDFGAHTEEKENHVPFSTSYHSGSDDSVEKFILQGETTSRTHCGQALFTATNSHEVEDTFVGTDSDGFDDDGIEDEFLLSLAATQQLKHEFLASSRRRREADSEAICPIAEPAEPIIIHCDLVQFGPITDGPKLGDSFAMENLDDDDLLEGLENYESGIGEQTEDDSQLQGEKLKHIETSNPNHVARRRRRVLPWVKNPPSSPLLGVENDDDSVTPSPQSPCMGE